MLSVRFWSALFKIDLLLTVKTLLEYYLHLSLAFVLLALLRTVFCCSAKEMQCNLYKCFVDLSKAYDKVNRVLLWHILKLRGFPPKIIAVVRGLMVGSKAYVRVNGILADPFDLECGLKQGSVFAPLLFNIFFGAIIEIFQKKVLEESGGIRLSVSTENGMFF